MKMKVYLMLVFTVVIVLNFSMSHDTGKTRPDRETFALAGCVTIRMYIVDPPLRDHLA